MQSLLPAIFFFIILAFLGCLLGGVIIRLLHLPSEVLTITILFFAGTMLSEIAFVIGSSYFQNRNLGFFCFLLIMLIDSFIVVPVMRKARRKLQSK